MYPLRLVSQILFRDNHCSRLMIFSPYRSDVHRTALILRTSGRNPSLSAHSEIAAGGIASRLTLPLALVDFYCGSWSGLWRVNVSPFFHILSDVGKRSSLWLSHPVGSGIVPPTFQSGGTSPDIIPQSGTIGIARCRASPSFCSLDFPPHQKGGRLSGLSRYMCIIPFMLQ